MKFAKSKSDFLNNNKNCTFLSENRLNFSKNIKFIKSIELLLRIT